jgi:hypothetical protein
METRAKSASTSPDVGLFAKPRDRLRLSAAVCPGASSTEEPTKKESREPDNPPLRATSDADREGRSGAAPSPRST